SQLPQTPDSRQDAAGGEADVPHADVQPLGMVHQLQEPEHVVQVVQGLADTHKDDVADILAAVQLGEQHLIQDLRGPQIPDLPTQGGGAEGAAHAAAHLAGDTYRVAVVVAHKHRLDAVAVP